MKKLYAIIAILSVSLTIGAAVLNLEDIAECRMMCDLQFPFDIGARTLCYNSCYNQNPHYTREFCQFYCKDVLSIRLYEICVDSCMDGELILD